MSTIFEPKYLNLPEQVQKNKKDIEELFGRLIELFNTQQVLSTQATSIQKSETNIGSQTYENGFIIDTTGNVFKINAENETNDLLYIEYYTTISGPQGAQGVPGQNGQNGTNAGFGTPTASATSVTGNPTVTVTTSGPDTAKVFNFQFGLPKGEQGEPGQSIVGPRGPQGVPGQSIQGPQGVPGEPGRDGNSFVVTGSVTSVNDLPDASTTAAGTAYFVGGTYPRPVYVVVESEGNKIWQNQGTLQGPRGLQGIQGVPGQDGQDGIGVTFMGAWLSGQTYYYNDQVTYTENGIMSSYILINENGLTSTTPPPQDATNWQPSSRGVAGPQGVPGEPGQNGQNGVDGAPGANAGFGTPTASATSVTGNPTVSVTTSGPDTEKVFNFQFGLPKGDQGPQGIQGVPGVPGPAGVTGLFYKFFDLRSAPLIAGRNIYKDLCVLNGATTSKALIRITFFVDADPSQTTTQGEVMLAVRINGVDVLEYGQTVTGSTLPMVVRNNNSTSQFILPYLYTGTGNNDTIQLRVQSIYSTSKTRLIGCAVEVVSDGVNLISYAE